MENSKKQKDGVQWEEKWNCSIKTHQNLTDGWRGGGGKISFTASSLVLLLVIWVVQVDGHLFTSPGGCTCFVYRPSWMHMSRTGRTVVNKETKTKRLKDENKSSVVFIFLLLWNFFFSQCPAKQVRLIRLDYLFISLLLSFHSSCFVERLWPIERRRRDLEKGD